MTRKTITKEIEACDFCKGDNPACEFDKCLHCGKQACYECEKKHITTFTHGMYCGGSGDGYYCKDCESESAELLKDELYRAYVDMKALRCYAEAMHNQIAERGKELEEKIKELRITRGI